MLRFHITDSVKQEATALLGGNANLAQWFMDEMKRRAESELSQALADQAVVSAANFKAAHRPMDGLGQCMFRVAQSLHNWIVKWVSPDYVYDEAFLAQLIKDNDHLRLKPTFERKAQIIRPEFPVVTPSREGGAA